MFTIEHNTFANFLSLQFNIKIKLTFLYWYIEENYKTMLADTDVISPKAIINAKIQVLYWYYSKIKRLLFIFI